MLGSRGVLGVGWGGVGVRGGEQPAPWSLSLSPARPLTPQQFLAFFGVHQMALSFFWFIAALGRTHVFANTIGIFTLLMGEKDEKADDNGEIGE